ncbi:alpha/beta fold hydrolase [Mycolicibacterium neworleansense]|uniref:Oxidoreductase n=1 Tax=Mycolicibacterium neworleansense TaxID=146018 RepID=A0A0H5RXY5_9MYCO|nr:alpha/beta hydrolase [Mycolicibacterium neworleansense]MCV7361229.1 alpha/beta hydrolase [Mycolicibacterium neworleansense]CRZ18377.1 oxidoreductase [Mycolicibacterium neworleansense]
MNTLNSRRLVTLPGGPVGVRETGTGRPVVLLHGLVANGLVWRHVAGGLGTGIRCIAPDLAMGSHTPAVPDADLSLPGLGRTVIELLDGLDIERAVLVGNGYGGDIAQVVAACYPERVEALVLVATNAFDSDPWPVKVLSRLASLPGAGLLQSKLIGVKPVQRLRITYGGATKRPIPAEIMAEYLRPLRTDPLVREDYRRFLEALSPAYLAEYSPRLADYDRPALVIWPREERYFPAEGAARLARTLPQATLEFIDDSYAWAPEDNPAPLVSLLRTFLGRVERAGSGQPCSTTLD